MASGDTISTVEREFVISALRDGLRVDGRAVMEGRRITIGFQRVKGQSSAEVQLGRTRVIAVVNADVVPPFTDRATDGFIKINVELSPMASPSFEAGRPSVEAIGLMRVLERVIRESRAIDTEALCIVAGEKVWSLSVDVHVVDHGGNLLDACSLAAMAALMHFRRPDVSIVGDKVQIHSLQDRAPVPLSIHHTPITISYAVFDELDTIAMDPTDREEAVMSGSAAFAVNAHGELCGVHKIGGTPIPGEEILRCAKRAVKQGLRVLEFLKKAVDEADVAEKKLAIVRHAAAAGEAPMGTSTIKNSAVGADYSATLELDDDLASEAAPSGIGPMRKDSDDDGDEDGGEKKTTLEGMEASKMFKMDSVTGDGGASSDEDGKSTPIATPTTTAMETESPRTARATKELISDFVQVPKESTPDLADGVRKPRRRRKSKGGRGKGK